MTAVAVDLAGNRSTPETLNIPIGLNEPPSVTLTNLSPFLANGKEFTIQVKPNKGAVVIVNRTTPPELKKKMSLN